MEARTIAGEMASLSDTKDGDSPPSSSSAATVAALNALGYDEAAQYVYGINYSDWKKKHAKKASDEQM